MSIIEDLCDDKRWDDFLLSQRIDSKDLADTMRVVSYIKERKYRPVVDAIANGTYVFSDPVMKEKPKADGGVRRIFTFKTSNFDDHMVIRMINRLLNRYEYLFAPNLYSMGKNHGVEGTVFDLISVKDIENKYFFKFDITDYGNSIRCDRLIEMMIDKLDACDMGIIDVLHNILKNPNVLVTREIDAKKTLVKETVELKGVMTGLPTTTFLSSIYLSDMDWHFYNLNVPYFRFNDDILVIADTEDEILSYKNWMLSYIAELGLTTNEKKMIIVPPGEGFDYLGLRIDDGEISITSKVVKRKKSQLRARANRINKMVIDRKISRETAMGRMIDYTHSSFYNPDAQFSFSRVYFQRITSSKYLKEIDEYAQDCIRYVYTGRFKGIDRKKVPYDELTKRGYVPLVSAYRMYCEGKIARHSSKKKQKDNAEYV